MDTGLLIARLVLGLARSARGAHKLFGEFGGYVGEKADIRIQV